MRVALAGKGGAGKTTLSATLCRLLARDGHRVVAIDADSNPNLGTALGLGRELAGEGGFLPAGIVSRRLDGGPGLKDPVDTVLERHALPGPDGVSLLRMGMPGHADEGCLCSAHAVVSAVLGDLGAADVITIVDMEASPEHLSRGTARHVDMLLLVAEPYYRALETIKRMARLADELPIPRVGVVANKLRSPSDLDAVVEFCVHAGLEVVAEVPWSESVLDADRAETPLVDGGASEVLAAVRGLAKLLVAEHLPEV